jgi:hypothetical protein
VGPGYFRVDDVDVDAHYRRLQAQGLMVNSPQDATSGERFFHVIDPDGHELASRNCCLRGFSAEDPLPKYHTQEAAIGKMP